ncbi:MAG: GGDEF domain-containing protein [Arcobacter sp.]|nr:GGDEF domain-containing protein [Arcobacter sp.]
MFFRKFKSNKKNTIKTLFLIDILYIKDINAMYGFDNGDLIIKQLYKFLKQHSHHIVKDAIKKDIQIGLKNSHVDVFELMVYDNLSIEEITKIKDSIFNKIINHEFYLLDKKTFINIDTTIGASKSHTDKIKVYAEKALYLAKTNYLNFMYYDSYLHSNEHIEENILNILNHNIENKLVEPYLQTIIDNQNSKIVKYEALMRIFDEKGQEILPGAFLQKAKKSRLYPKLMKILIDKVITYIVKYKINISINYDYTDIINVNLTNYLINQIKDNNIGKFITIEILEHEKITNFAIVNDFINDLKKYGVQFAIDDFGIGFSNFEYILNLNIDYIKIDGSLIKRIDEEIYLNLIKSIVLFCKQQDIKIVAEYVINLKILRYVKAIDIDYFQGYYISKPMPIDLFIEEGKK